VKEDKTYLSHFKLLFLLMALTIVAPQARPASAAEVPDSFREKVVDVTSHCYPVFNRLSETYWPERDPAEVAELKQDALAKRDYSLDMLRRYSAIYSNFDIGQELDKAEREINLGSAGRDTLLDLAIMCEKELFALVDEEAEKSYTP